MKEKIISLICVFMIIACFSFLIYNVIVLSLTDYNEYWIKRFDEDSNKLTKICKDNFGNNSHIAMQNPSYFTCCVSEYSDLCEKGTESNFFYRPRTIKDALFDMLK